MRAVDSLLEDGARLSAVFEARGERRRESGRLGQTAGPEVIEELQARIVALAQKKRIVRGRSTRVDTTVVKTNVHDLTDSSLLGDGARVLTRTMKEVVAQKRMG